MGHVSAPSFSAFVFRALLPFLKFSPCWNVATAATCASDKCDAEPHAGLDDDTLFTDKKENAWTISRRFKSDILKFISDDLLGNCTVAVELGAHIGLTTGLLSRHCDQVWAVEHSLPVLETNMARNARFGNIVYLDMHSVLDSWKQRLPRNILAPENSFIFIDAAHDKASVLNDMDRARSDLGLRWLVLDDYGAEKGVREAVQAWIHGDAPKGRIHRYIGESPPWSFSDRIVEQWEGVILEALPVSDLSQVMSNLPPEIASASGARILDQLRNTTWIIYPPGVFLSGSFQSLGKLDLSAQPGDASLTLQRSSYTDFIHGSETGTSADPLVDTSMEYRPMFEAPEVENGFVLAGQALGRWQFRITGAGTGGLLLSDANPEMTFVLVAESMVRTIGEKLLSALY